MDAPACAEVAAGGSGQGRGAGVEAVTHRRDGQNLEAAGEGVRRLSGELGRDSDGTRVRAELPPAGRADAAAAGRLACANTCLGRVAFASSTAVRGGIACETTCIARRVAVFPAVADSQHNPREEGEDEKPGLPRANTSAPSCEHELGHSAEDSAACPARHGVTYTQIIGPRERAVKRGGPRWISLPEDRVFLCCTDDMRRPP
jgi:hypothetical protein